MEKVNDLLGNVMGSKSSVTTGVSTVILSLFTSKLFPKIPNRFYKLLDNDIVRIGIMSFLLNKELKNPTQSLMIGTIIVLVVHFLVNMIAPDAPPLSSLIKPDSDEKGSSEAKSCNCYCGSKIYTNSPPQGESIPPQKP